MTDPSGSRPGIELRRYWDILVSRWAVLVIAMALGVIAAAVYLIVVPSTYVSTTTVSVFPITTDPYAANRNSLNLVDMSAEAATASSFTVAQIASDASDGEWDPTELRRATAATAASDSTTMTIAVEASTEARARSGAGAMAEAYLESRSDQAANSIDSGVERDRERIDQYRQQLTNAIERLATEAPGSPGAAEASADQQTLNLQISTLVERVSSLEGIDTTGGVVLNPASMTSVSVEPSTLTTLATGLALGLVAGVIVAFVTRRRRKHVNTASDLSRELDIETIGALNVGQLEAGVGAVAQRILRLIALNDASVVSIIFVDGAQWPSPLVDSLAARMQESGTDAVVATAAQADVSSTGDVVLLAVGPESPDSDRLQALRVSDVTVLVIGARVTTFSNLAAPLEGADEMGSRVVGAILLDGPK